MIDTDEDALICDLAETYQIYDYRQLPPKMVAVFSHGLKNDSRIKMKLSNQTLLIDTLLKASIADSLKTLVWFQTEDGQKGKNRPASLISLLTNSNRTDNEINDVIVFNSGEDFEKQRKQLMKGGE